MAAFMQLVSWTPQGLLVYGETLAHESSNSTLLSCGLAFWSNAKSAVTEISLFWAYHSVRE